MRPEPPGATLGPVMASRRRVLLLGVAGLLSASALLAIGILLAGSFGRTEQRILGSTALLAGFGLVALPAVVLLDQGRGRMLARAAAAAAALAASLALGLVWGASGSDDFGRSFGSAAIVALALAQLCTVTALRGGRDPTALRRLFAASCATAVLVAALGVTLLWAAPEGGAAPRLFGALLVLDLLLVALQPVLRRARTDLVVRQVTVVTEAGERIELEVAGRDLATAAARAIRAAEGAGQTVVGLWLAAGGEQQRHRGTAEERRREHEREDAGGDDHTGGIGRQPTTLKRA